MKESVALFAYFAIRDHIRTLNLVSTEVYLDFTVSDAPKLFSICFILCL
jgi:hypothetical protein